MTRANLQWLRALLCFLSLVLLGANSPFWWIAVVPWIILCVHGIVLTLPLIFLVGIGAGGAQADWMGDGFAMTLFIILPTFFSMVVSQLISIWMKRKTEKV